ncbi:MAG: AMP-binding protein, partial [Actinomycetota bacterium]|nr:AMP-binding protein [Actinomycetota bacterium]
MGLADLLATTAARLPGKAALVVPGGVTVTFAELDAGASRIARGLRSSGIAPGERVALAMGNVPAFASAYFGILRARAVVVPLNTMLTTAEVRRVLEHAEAKVVLTEGSCEQVVRDAAGDAKVISADEFPTFGDAAGDVDVEVSDDDLAVLAYTSGTTGTPKGAMLTHGNLRANLDQQMAIPASTVTEDDILFLALPLFHIFGLNVTLGLLAMNGATGILVERFEPIRTLEVIQRHKVTILFGAPPMYSSWAATPGADQYD